MALLGMVGLFLFEHYKNKHQSQAHHQQPQVQMNVRGAFLELAFEDPERAIQHQLEACARDARLDDPEGLRAFLANVLMLTRRQIAHVEHGRLLRAEGDMESVEASYRGWMSNARAKFDRDVLLRQGARTQEAAERNLATSALEDEDGDFETHQYVVMSLGLAWEDCVKLGKEFENLQHLEDLIQRLGFLTTSQLMVAEVIWSPSAESDSMGKSDMLATYPELRPL